MASVLDPHSGQTGPSSPAVAAESSAAAQPPEHKFGLVEDIPDDLGHWETQVLDLWVRPGQRPASP